MKVSSADMGRRIKFKGQLLCKYLKNHVPEPIPAARQHMRTIHKPRLHCNNSIGGVVRNPSVYFQSSKGNNF